MKKTWIVTVGKDSGKIVLFDYSVKNVFKLAVEDIFYTVDTHVTRHWLCSSGLPDIFWRLPIGRPRYDYDFPINDEKTEFLVENSVGAALYTMSSRLSEWVSADLEKDKVEELEISREEAFKLEPSLKELFEED